LNVMKVGTVRHLISPINKIISISGILFLIIASSSIVKAEDKPQFGIRPASVGSPTTVKGYFELKGQPGEVLSDAVVVSNPGNVPVKLLVYSVDASTGQQGGINYLTNTDPRKQVGAWVTLGSDTVELAPQKQITVPFKLTIPKDAKPGQHLGGIAVQLADIQGPATKAANQNDASMGVKTVTRALTAIQVSVSGGTEVPMLKITGAEVIKFNGENVLSLGLQNDGNSLIQPKGEVTLTDSGGKVVVATTITLNSILPQDSIAYPVPGNLPAGGTYKVHASLDFGGSAPAVYDGQVEVKAQPVATVAAKAPAVSPVSTATTAPSSDNNSVLIGILIGVTAVLSVSTLGLGGYVLFGRGKKSKN
jgi:hypothetical protein